MSIIDRPPAEGPREREPKEYSFEEGFAEVMRRIKILYSNTDHDLVVICVNSGTPNVGKSYLEKRIARELGQSGIPNTRFTDDDILDINQSQTLLDLKAVMRRKFGVWFIQSGSILAEPTRHDSIVKIKSRGKIVGDLYVVIYRPGNDSFQKLLKRGKYVGDIFIKNEGAVDK